LFAFDLVICRNVMIYFDAPTIRRLADQFHRTLVPGGWLAVGHAEPHTEIFQEYRTINAPGAVLYQRASFHHPAPTPRAFPKLAPVVPVPTKPIEVEIPAVTFRLPVVATPEIAPVERQTDLERLRHLANTGQIDAAQACCERLIAEDRLNASYHFFLGLILAQREDLLGASKALNRCLYLQRDLALAHYYLGVLELSLGGKAGRHFRNCRQLLASLEEREPVPLGDELTVGELRALVAIHLPPHE
jgi:chemotaxis protein methyltransferase CheR